MFLVQQLVLLAGTAFFIVLLNQSGVGSVSGRPEPQHTIERRVSEMMDSCPRTAYKRPSDHMLRIYLVVVVGSTPLASDTPFRRARIERVRVS